MVSAAIPSLCTSAPASAAWAASITELLSWIWAGPRGWPGGTSSSPVEMTARRGRRWTSTVAPPVAASRAMAAASQGRPAGSSAAPSATSVPARRTLSPGRAASRMATETGSPAVPGSASVSSTGTTVSAPGGTSPRS